MKITNDFIRENLTKTIWSDLAQWEGDPPVYASFGDDFGHLGDRYRMAMPVETYRVIFGELDTQIEAIEERPVKKLTVKDIRALNKTLDDIHKERDALIQQIRDVANEMVREITRDFRAGVAPSIDALEEARAARNARRQRAEEAADARKWQTMAHPDAIPQHIHTDEDDEELPADMWEWSVPAGSEYPR